MATYEFQDIAKLLNFSRTTQIQTDKALKEKKVDGHSIKAFIRFTHLRFPSKSCISARPSHSKTFKRRSKKLAILETSMSFTLISPQKVSRRDLRGTSLKARRAAGPLRPTSYRLSKTRSKPISVK